MSGWILPTPGLALERDNFLDKGEYTGEVKRKAFSFNRVSMTCCSFMTLANYLGLSVFI